MTTTRKQRSTRFTSIDRWHAAFCAQAEADDYEEIQRHIEYLNLQTTPERFVDAMYILMYAACSFIEFNGKSYLKFLNKQKYRLNGYSHPHYCLTFQLGLERYGRLICDETFTDIDLGALYLQTWDRFRCVGFNSLYVSKIDGTDISIDEFQRIKSIVEEDIYFDFERSDLSVGMSWVDDEFCTDTLVVTVDDLPH